MSRTESVDAAQLVYVRLNCPSCGRRMRVATTAGTVVYLRCPRSGCRATAKYVRLILPRVNLEVATG